MAQINFTFQPGTSFEHILGFEVAHRILSRYIQDDITLNLHVAFTNGLPDGVIGGAVPVNVTTDVSTVQAALTQDVTSADDALAVANLNVSIGDDGIVQYTGQYGDGTYSGDRLTLTQAQAQAMGIELSNGSQANPSQIDGYILLNTLEGTPYQWSTDYGRTQPPDSNSLDLLSVILHEMGHVFGFVSGVDNLDVLTETNSLGALSLLDLYRYSAESLAQNAQEMTPGDDAFFSIDGGETAIAAFSTGVTEVLGGIEGYQASHWANNALDAINNVGEAIGIDNPIQSITDFIATLFSRSEAATPEDEAADLFDLLVDPNIGQSIFEGQTANVTIDTEGGQSIGIMDPALAPGERSELSDLDLQAFDVLGYDLAANVEPIDYVAILAEAQAGLANAGVNPGDTSALERDRWQDVLTAVEENAEIYERRRKRYNTRKGSLWQEEDIDFTTVNILSDGAGETAQIIIDGSSNDFSGVITTVEANAPQAPLVLRTINLDGGEANDLVIPAYDVFQRIDAGDGQNVVQLGNNGGMVMSGDGNDTVLSLDNNVIVTPGDGDNVVVLNSDLESVTNHQVSTQTGDDYVVSTGADRVSVSTSTGNDIVAVNSTKASVSVGSGHDIVKLYVTDHATVHADNGNDQLQIISDQTATVSTGNGNDIVILGDRSTPYYADNGTTDVITITDFSATDQLQLHGTSRDYSIVGNGLFYQGDLIARFGDGLENRLENGINFTLFSAQLQFVNESTPDDHDRSVVIPTVEEQLVSVQSSYTRGPEPNYRIAGGKDADLFTIDGFTGELRFINPPMVSGAYEVIVQAESDGQTDTQALTVDYTPDDSSRNEATTVLPSATNADDVKVDNAIARAVTTVSSSVKVDDVKVDNVKVNDVKVNDVKVDNAIATVSSNPPNPIPQQTVTPDPNDPGKSVIGNQVFLDVNGDGKRQKGDKGVAGVQVILTGAGDDGIWGTSDDIRLTKTTNRKGKFQFKKLKGGGYRLEVKAPDGFGFTQQNVGSEKRDSDADANGITDVFILAAGQKNNKVDVGLIAQETSPVQTADMAQAVTITQEANPFQAKATQAKTTQDKATSGARAIATDIGAVDMTATVVANVPEMIKQTLLKPGPVTLFRVKGLSGNVTDKISHTVTSNENDPYEVAYKAPGEEYRVGESSTVFSGGQEIQTHTFSQTVQGAELKVWGFGAWITNHPEYYHSGESVRIWLDGQSFDLRNALDNGIVSLSNVTGDTVISNDGLLVNHSSDLGGKAGFTLTIDREFSSIAIESLSEQGVGVSYQLNVATNDGVIEEAVKVDNPDFEGVNAVTIDVLSRYGLADATAVEATSLTVTSIETPLNGTAKLVDNQVVYTPNIGFSGIETFDYTIRDGQGRTETATIQITVEPPANSVSGTGLMTSDAVSRPFSAALTSLDTTFVVLEANNDSVAMNNQGGAIAIDILTNQVSSETDSFTISNASTPSDGSVEIIDNQVVYTPNPGFFGIETIAYTINDGEGGVETEQVKVKVLSPTVDLAIEKKVENLSRPESGSVLHTANVGRVTLTVTNTSYSVATGIAVEDILPSVLDAREPGEKTDNFYSAGRSHWGWNPLEVHSWTSADIYVWEPDGSKRSFQRNEQFLETLDTNPQESTNGQITIYDPEQAYMNDPSSSGLVTWSLGKSLGPGESATLEYYVRRNSVYEWPDDRRAIAQVTAVDQEDTNLDNNQAIYWTPIAFDLNGDGIQTLSVNDGVKFDLHNTGQATDTGWLSGQDGFLAIDNDGDGRISSRAELFGGAAVGDGFAKLATFDSNGDGLVNETDDQFASLKLWQDANENGITDSGELLPLESVGITDLQTAYTNVFSTDAQDNIHGEHSTASLNGRLVDMVDVYFQTVG